MKKHHYIPSKIDGYVREFNTYDGYVFVRPYHFLHDGYQYDIIRNNVIIATGIAITLTLNNYGPKTFLQKLNNRPPLSGIKLNDLVRKKV